MNREGARAQLARLTDVPRGPPGPGRRRPPSPRAPERVVPVGRVIRFRTGDVAGELHLLTYVQTAAGARFTNGTHGQFLHLLTSGATSEYTWRYGWIADRLPVLWLRDRDNRWHTARPARTAQLRNSDDFLLWLRVVPPLDYGAPQADLVATGLSAEVRAGLPLTWSESRPSAGPAARS